MGNILIVDDDVDVCNLMVQCAMQEGYIPIKAHTSQEAYIIIEKKSNSLTLIVLDIMLPDGNGLSLLSHIHTQYGIPVIMVTAKDSLEDKVIGLRLGADDYLTKPFSLKEFGARINALARRYSFPNSNSPNRKPLEFKKLIIDCDNRAVYCNNTEIFLTGKEFDILHFLASNQGKVFTKKQIYEDVWMEPYFFDDNTIMSIISRIRKKLEANCPDISYVETIRGIGYRFSREV